MSCIYPTLWLSELVGHYERKLETKAGEVRLKIPKLRRLPFETAIIERYRRREASVGEAFPSESAARSGAARAWLARSRTADPH